MKEKFPSLDKSFDGVLNLGDDEGNPIEKMAQKLYKDINSIKLSFLKNNLADVKIGQIKQNEEFKNLRDSLDKEKQEKLKNFNEEKNEKLKNLSFEIEKRYTEVSGEEALKLFYDAKNDEDKAEAIKKIGVISSISYLKAFLDNIKESPYAQKILVNQKTQGPVKLYGELYLEKNSDKQIEIVRVYNKNIDSTSYIKALLECTKENSDTQKVLIEKFTGKVENIIDFEDLLYYMQKSQDAKKIFINQKSENSIIDLYKKLYINQENSKNQKNILEEFFLKNPKVNFKTNDVIYFINIIKNDKECINLFINNNAEKWIDEETVDYKNISLLSNVLSSNKNLKNTIETKALTWLKSEKEILKQKACLMLIALGEKVGNFSKNDIQFFAETLLKTYRTKEYGITKIASNDYFLNVGKEKNMSLARYFSSIISTVQETGVEKKQKEIFKEIVSLQEKIKNEPIFQGKELVLFLHKEGDTTDSFYEFKDSFNPTSYLKLAKQCGLKVPKEIIRHKKGEIEVEDFLQTLKESEGPVTLLIGGHGSEGKISFGSEDMKMDQLIEVLNNNPKKVKMIVFHSCHSDFNAQHEILKKWQHKDLLPPIILSSSNSNSHSLKMALDAWHYFVNYVIPEFPPGKKPTWEDFWNNLEGRLMVLGKEGRLLEWLFKDEISDPALFWPIKNNDKVEIMQISQNQTQTQSKNKIQPKNNNDTTVSSKDKAVSNKENDDSKKGQKNWLIISESDNNTKSA